MVQGFSLNTETQGFVPLLGKLERGFPELPPCTQALWLSGLSLGLPKFRALITRGGQVGCGYGYRVLSFRAGVIVGGCVTVTVVGKGQGGVCLLCLCLVGDCWWQWVKNAIWGQLRLPVLSAAYACLTRYHSTSSRAT
jgi:hypothetical protein